MQKSQKNPWIKPQLVTKSVKETLAASIFNEGQGQGKGNSGPNMIS